MKKFLLLFSSVFFLSISGQKHCDTNEKMSQFFKNNPQAKTNQESLRNFLVNNNYNQTKKLGVITIPVVVHVIYKTTVQNVSDAQIASQITVLNNDFRKLNSDFSTVVPTAFQSSAADMELAFCMATKKPDGTPTTGIERKQVASSFDFDDNYYLATGLSAWDPTKYLNIWVGPFTDTSLLGWAYLPDAAGYSFDGLCIGYYCFGTMGTAQSPYNLGRTATHEIGHYFGLQHPWGESDYGNTPDSSVCGTTGWSDFCADTPATYYPYFGAPTYPTNT